MTSASPSPLTLRLLLAPGLAALVRFHRPFLLIQAAALALVVSYFLFPSVRDICASISSFQTRGGVLFAAFASAVAGAILPELAKLATGLGGKLPRQRLHDVAFNAVFFAFSGVVVFYFYALQSRIFGDDAQLPTIVKKVIVDQFVFSIVWAVPYSLFMFSWKAAGYNLPATFAELTPRKLALRVPSMLLPIWAFWIPMVSMIYALPAELQFALFSLALAAWSLLVVFIAEQKQPDVA